MQSFLQQRRFSKHVKRQYERDIGRAKDKEKESGKDCNGGDTLQNGQTEDIERGSESHEANGDDLSILTAKQTIGTALGTTLTGIEVRDRTTKEGGRSSAATSQVFVVGYEGSNDPMNPHNWSVATRLVATLNVAAIGWIVGFASSVDSAALRPASEEFGVSQVAESLATGIFLIGFGVGALFAGPVSETVGRNPVYVATLTLYMIFVMASALAPNAGAQFVFRFLAGCFASTPLVCAGGSIGDLWSPLERSYAFPVFANASFLGPILGPVVGGFVVESKLLGSWRWTDWITLIISGLVLVLVLLFQPETYAPILLSWKAKDLRQLTGDNRYKAEVEIRDVPFITRLGHALYRPFLLTFSEPIIILIALYLTIIYIILFAFLNGYTFIFTDTYGFNDGTTGLCFLGIAVGLCLASILTPILYIWTRNDLAKTTKQGGNRLRPETRLWFAMFGAPAIPISLFWMGWTAYPSISYWSPLAASVLFGYGILCIFISSYLYIIDSYEASAASALSGITFIRYVAAGVMVEVAIPFYKNVGVHFTLTILGCLSALLVPVPYIFYRYGPTIRRRSKYAVA